MCVCGCVLCVRVSVCLCLYVGGGGSVCVGGGVYGGGGGGVRRCLVWCLCDTGGETDRQVETEKYTYIKTETDIHTDSETNKRENNSRNTVLHPH